VGLGGSSIQFAEITFLISVKMCAGSDMKKNKEVREELNIFAARDKLNFYRQKWTECLD
jgi:hypothetical protein